MGKPGLAYEPDTCMAAEAQPSTQSGNPQVDTAETASTEAGVDPCAAATHDDRENVPNCNLTNVRTVEQAQDFGRGCTNLKADTHHLHEAGARCNRDPRVYLIDQCNHVLASSQLWGACMGHVSVNLKAVLGTPPPSKMHGLGTGGDTWSWHCLHSALSIR